MRRIIFGSLIALAATTASAHGHWEYRGGSWNWMAPAVVGGVIVYEATRPPVYVQPAPPVVIQQQPVIVQSQNCSPWTQIQNPDGTITTTRTCTQ